MSGKDQSCRLREENVKLAAADVLHTNLYIYIYIYIQTDTQTDTHTHINMHFF